MLSLNCRGKLLNITNPMVMGIINLTPDSFYSESRKSNADELLKSANKMLTEGGDILDLGTCSTRPNSSAVGTDAELQRLDQNIALLKKEFPDCIISIDSYDKAVVKEALEQGADIVNDVSGDGLNNGLAQLAKDYSVPYVLSHNPVKLHSPEKSENFSLVDCIAELSKKRLALIDFGLKDVIIDPAFGFGKTLNDNYLILKHLKSFECLESVLMVGVSRKRMIWELLESDANSIKSESVYLGLKAAEMGANIIRTHDVKETVNGLKLLEKLR